MRKKTVQIISVMMLTLKTLTLTETTFSATETNCDEIKNYGHWQTVVSNSIGNKLLLDTYYSKKTSLKQVHRIKQELESLYSSYSHLPAFSHGGDLSLILIVPKKSGHADNGIICGMSELVIPTKITPNYTPNDIKIVKKRDLAYSPANLSEIIFELTDENQYDENETYPDNLAAIDHEFGHMLFSEYLKKLHEPWAEIAILPDTIYKNYSGNSAFIENRKKLSEWSDPNLSIIYQPVQSIFYSAYMALIKESNQEIRNANFLKYQQLAPGGSISSFIALIKLVNAYSELFADTFAVLQQKNLAVIKELVDENYRTFDCNEMDREYDSIKIRTGDFSHSFFTNARCFIGDMIKNYNLLGEITEGVTTPQKVTISKEDFLLILLEATNETMQRLFPPKETNLPELDLEAITYSFIEINNDLKNGMERRITAMQLKAAESGIDNYGAPKGN
ncbi:MAG: hypothetical protein HQK53_01995 [Oligoflexia bacterium]|nr:hypothetical protein [Oligoflexia bacterium]